MTGPCVCTRARLLQGQLLRARRAHHLPPGGASPSASACASRPCPPNPPVPPPPPSSPRRLTYLTPRPTPLLPSAPKDPGGPQVPPRPRDHPPRPQGAPGPLFSPSLSPLLCLSCLLRGPLRASLSSLADPRPSCPPRVRQLENLLLADNRRLDSVKIADFGLARSSHGRGAPLPPPHAPASSAAATRFLSLPQPPLPHCPLSPLSPRLRPLTPRVRPCPGGIRR